jgi:hypothetical protein
VLGLLIGGSLIFTAAVSSAGTTVNVNIGPPPPIVVAAPPPLVVVPGVPVVSYVPAVQGGRGSSLGREDSRSRSSPCRSATTRYRPVT